MNERQITRFEKRMKSDGNGCHIWQGCKNEYGYGCVRLSGKTRFAHRVAYEHYKGTIPVGYLVRHKCDNRACVNPAHLEIGTHLDNMRDMAERGRHFSKTTPERITRGSAHGMSKLDEVQVREIRAKQHQPGNTSAVVATGYEVSSALVRMIWRRDVWAHV